ncbi:hypothetical protein [Agrococcus sediminis]|uniref:hypothetical protein n=1 Tax=Agrococcus sediminis TaxID=2599924 RepID=UPI0034424B34
MAASGGKVRSYEKFAPLRRTFVASAGLMTLSPTRAQADDAFGQMVAMCAQMDVGGRGTPPTVTCMCNDQTMTFANFGATVRHIKDMTCTNCTDCC